MMRLRRWTKLFVLAGLVCLIAGDTRSQSSSSSTGIDPLAVLDLEVKANAVVVLDTSGSMAESVVANADNFGSISGQFLTGDDPRSKLVIAKTTLQTLIQSNQTKVKFRFGSYTGNQSLFRLLTNDRFLYYTTNSSAAGMSINSAGSGASAPGIARKSDEATTSRSTERRTTT